MSWSIQANGVLVRSYFTVYDVSNAPVTGLVDGDFTKLLAFNGAVSVIPVTVTEIGGGRYFASWTPSANGDYYLVVRNAIYNPRGWDEEYTVTTDGVIDIAEILSALVEPGFSLSRVLRIIASAVAGKSTGGPAGFIARNLPDTADQVTGAADGSGNRTAATYGP